MFGKKKEDKDLALLTTVTTNCELGLIKGILDENKIPCLVQDRGSGGYMRVYAGNSIFGTDIYVSPANLDRAKELIAVLDLEHPSEISEEALARQALEAGEPEE